MVRTMLLHAFDIRRLTAVPRLEAFWVRFTIRVRLERISISLLSINVLRGNAIEIEVINHLYSCMKFDLCHLPLYHWICRFRSSQPIYIRLRASFHLCYLFVLLSGSHWGVYVILPKRD